jgi:hypothetical protein
MSAIKADCAFRQTISNMLADDIGPHIRVIPSLEAVKSGSTS